jgi:hypothetical protein
VVYECCQDFSRGAGSWNIYVHTYVLGVSAVAMKSSIFWDIAPWVTDMLEEHVSCLAYSPALKMKAACSSETSVDFHQTTVLYPRRWTPIRVCHLRLSSLVHPGKNGESISEVGTCSYPVVTGSCSFMIRGEHRNTSPLATLNYCHIERLFPVLVMWYWHDPHNINVLLLYLRTYLITRPYVIHYITAIMTKCWLALILSIVV